MSVSVMRSELPPKDATSLYARLVASSFGSLASVFVLAALMAPTNSHSLACEAEMVFTFVAAAESSVVAQAESMAALIMSRVGFVCMCEPLDESQHLDNTWHWVFCPLVAGKIPDGTPSSEEPPVKIQ